MPKEKGALLALAIGGPKKKPSAAPGLGPELEEDEDDYDVHAASFDALADALSIPPEKQDSAREALKSYVLACIRESKTGE